MRFDYIWLWKPFRVDHIVARRFLIEFPYVLEYAPGLCLESCFS